ncbi:hypothetical protein C2S51_032741 [Perilla frutescens var. frutescens]|nr:hypothetical protein C2S51_032741 [Perilla frutescens var. frutescens]
MDYEPLFGPIDLNFPPPNIDLSNDNFSYSQVDRVQIDLNQSVQEEDDISHNTNIELSNSHHLPNKRKNLTSDTKRAVFEMILIELQGERRFKGLISKVANSFSISTRLVSRIWHQGKSVTDANDVGSIFASKFADRTWSQKKVELSLEEIKNIPLCRRTNIRSFSRELGMPRSTLHRRIKEGNIRPHSNAIKPYLSDVNKKARLEFCLSMVDHGTNAPKSTFFSMHDQIHIDEKWFYMSNTSEKFYLHSEENEPVRTCKSKRFITKIMFLAAVARPRVDTITGEEFNGKIGIWPFVSYEPAKRKCKNRAAGTMEAKPIVSVTKDVIRSYVLTKLLPSIKEKWSSSSSRTIFIQQDNARPHLDINDAHFVEEAQKDGFDIRLCCQPPNSPDMNVLDLGFFRAIDSLQHQEAPSTIEEFVAAVENSFEKFPTQELNNVFLTLQSYMVEVMKSLDGNNYKIPHMNKPKLIRDGQLPNCIEFETEIIDVAKTNLGS